jgi:outer membrane biosynthesis protein TonB
MDASRKRGRPLLPLRLLVPALSLLLASACTHAQAKTAPDMPALDMPAPPAREIVAMDVDEPPPAPPAEEPAPPAQPPRPRPAPRADAAKPEPPPVDTIKRPEEAPKPTAATNLQTTPSTTEAELERLIRESLARASVDLTRIDYRVLNADGKSQYDTAKRFIQQAEEAMRAKNLVFAKNLADKSASLAAQLADR